MDKMKFETTSLVDKNIDKIEQIFPGVVTEVKEADGTIRKAVDFEALKAELSKDIVEGRECYEFTWAGKNEAKYEAAKSIRKTLRPCKEESKNWDTTQNLYIEGDNLDVLKLLQESYLNKVKMIYIDPPYNTGNDFVYADDFRLKEKEYEDLLDLADEEGNRLIRNTDSNGRFHSDWCSMIYSRLKLARNLLTEDGVIFISIDDNEVANLKKICDEIFGTENFRNTILVRRRVKSLNSQFSDRGLFSMNVGAEYTLVYSKSSKFMMKALQMIKNNIPTKGRWDVFWSTADRPTMRYELLGFTPETGQWRKSKEKADVAVENYKKYLSEFEKDMTLEEYSQKTGIIHFIRRIPDGIGKNGGVQHWIAPSDTALRTSSWMDIEVSQISKEIDLPFDNPKNKQLIMELIKLVNAEDEIVLDFFSGSATTAHAVMQLNAEDGGKRKFVMVQLPEKCDENSEAKRAGFDNICEIGKERIRRAGEKIKQEYGEKAENLDIGFRVFKLDSTNMKDVYYTPAELTQDLLAKTESNIKDDRTDMDLLYGCLLDWGLELSMPHETKQIDGVAVHYVNQTDLIACFNTDVSEAVIRKIAADKPLRVVFRDSCFKNVSDKTNINELFKAISPETQIKVI